MAPELRALVGFLMNAVFSPLSHRRGFGKSQMGPIPSRIK